MSSLGAIIYTIGLPGSGKSTWARKQVAAGLERGENWVQTSRDEYRRMLFNHRWWPDSDGWSAMPSREREEAVTRAQRTSVVSLVNSGWNVIISDTNLRPEYRDEWQILALRLGTRARAEDFRHVPLETCIERDYWRGQTQPWQHYVGRKAITYLHETFIVPEMAE